MICHPIARFHHDNYPETSRSKKNVQDDFWLELAFRQLTLDRVVFRYVVGHEPHCWFTRFWVMSVGFFFCSKLNPARYFSRSSGWSHRQLVMSVCNILFSNTSSRSSHF